MVVGSIPHRAHQVRGYFGFWRYAQPNKKPNKGLKLEVSMAGSMRLVASPDTWELRVYLGRDSSGKVKHRYLRFRGSKRQAVRELARLVAEQEAEPEPIVESGLKWNASTTINDAISAWQANGWDDLSPSTTRRYESIWKVHISETIGMRKICSLTIPKRRIDS